MRSTKRKSLQDLIVVLLTLGLPIIVNKVVDKVLEVTRKW
jgi:hypothetical protein